MDRARHDKAGLDRTVQDWIGQDRTGLDRTVQDWIGQDRAGLVRTGQCRIVCRTTTKITEFMAM